MHTTIAILEDDLRRTDEMQQCLREVLPSYATRFFDNAPEMITWLRANLGICAAVVLDHDLGPDRAADAGSFDPGTGRDVADYLCQCAPCCPVLIHSSNSICADGMEFALRDADWTCDRVYPHSDLEWIRGQWIGKLRTLLPSPTPQ